MRKPSTELLPESKKLAAYIQTKQLDLGRQELPKEYYYASLPLCVIDAVFSISVNYESTRNTVKKWCQSQPVEWPLYQPPVDNLHTVDNFISILEPFVKDGSFEVLAADVFQNRQRVSPSDNGIRKAEAVYSFAKVLSKFGIQTRQDAMAVAKNEELEKSIRKIPGQKSGLSYKYFLMLAGDDDLVKADRHLSNFVSTALGRGTTLDETEALVIEACRLLRDDGFQQLTPRLLDYLIWEYQKNFSKETKKLRAS